MGNPDIKRCVAIIKTALYGFNSAFGVLGKILKFTKIVNIWVLPPGIATRRNCDTVAPLSPTPTKVNQYGAYFSRTPGFEWTDPRYNKLADYQVEG